jgi:hypothetical protein
VLHVLRESAYRGPLVSSITPVQTPRPVCWTTSTASSGSCKSPMANRRAPSRNIGHMPTSSGRCESEPPDEALHLYLVDDMTVLSHSRSCDLRSDGATPQVVQN